MGTFKRHQSVRKVSLQRIFCALGIVAAVLLVGGLWQRVGKRVKTSYLKQSGLEQFEDSKIVGWQRDKGMRLEVCGAFCLSL